MLPKGANFISPALLRHDVCQQCRRNSYIDKSFDGWNKYCEAWWTPCLTTTPFSIGKVILRAGHICCPPKIFLDMQKEVIILIDKNFSGDKRKLLRGSAGCTSQQKLYVTDSAPDWCPHQKKHETKKGETIEIFGAVTINKEIRFVMRCNCGHEWYVKEELPESTSLTGGIFVINSIPTKQKVICQLCGQENNTVTLKRLFFYG